MKIHSKLVAAILFFVLISFAKYYCQADSTYFTSVRINSNSIGNKSWNKLLLSKNDVISFGFETVKENSNNQEMLHRVFLNGNPFNLGNLLSKSVSFSNLDSGNYILKVQGFTKTGIEAKAAYLRFSVGTNSETINDEESTSEIRINKNLLYSLVALIIIVALIFLSKKIFLKGGKNNSGNGIERLNKKELLGEIKNQKENLNDLTYSYNRVKEEIKKMREQNNGLRQQVKELKQHIDNLEKANLELIEQKEKLEKSKIQVEELHDKKEKLFAIAVHDIKNPAAAIKGYVELLESYDLNAGEQQEIIQHLVDTSSRIVQLAQKMSIAIAQKEPETQSHIEKTSIKAIIDSVCNLNLANANRKRIKLINNASPNTPQIEIDGDKIHEAIDNIVNNAIKYSYPDSVVQVKSYFNEKRIFIEIVDNGTGLDSKDLVHLFEKGARLSSIPTAGEESSGLGLWIVKNIIDEHGGIIKVTSKKDAGTTFKIELPLKRKED